MDRFGCKLSDICESLARVTELHFPSQGEVHCWRLTYDDLVNILASKHREAALMEVHDGQVGSPPLCHIFICVQSHQQEVPLLLGFLHNSGL